MVFLLYPHRSEAGYRYVSNYSSVAPSSPHYGYDPSMLCYDGNPDYCPSGSFTLWLQSGFCSNSFKFDNIGRFSGSINTTWSQPLWESPCDDSRILCSDTLSYFDLEAYAGPDIFKDSAGRTFMVYSHGSGDTYNGNIEFRYKTNDSDPWSNPVTLFTISDKNISSCLCCGGFARVSAVDMLNHVYFYVEVWKINDSNEIEDKLCVQKKNGPNASSRGCYYGIGHQQIFLVKVERGDQPPYLKIDSGKAQIYKADTLFRNSSWLPMEVKYFTIPDPEVPEQFLPQYKSGYIFGWWDSHLNKPDYPQHIKEGYTYPDGQKIDYMADSLFRRSLGDVSRVADDKIVATLSFHGYDTNGNLSYETNTYTSESSNGVVFGDEREILNFSSISGLTQEEAGITTPTIYKGAGYDRCGRHGYYIAYSHVPINGGSANFGNAKVRFGKLHDAKDCEWPPVEVKPPIFRRVVNLNKEAFLDGDEDGVIDEEINLSLSNLNRIGFEELHAAAIQEQGYDVMLIVSQCYFKNKNQVVCSTDNSDVPGLIIDNDRRLIYLQGGFFEEGDELDLQIILRNYDKDRDNRNKIIRPKRCLKEDRCVKVKINILS